MDEGNRRISRIFSVPNNPARSLNHSNRLHLLIILNNPKHFLEHHHCEETPVLEKRSS